MTGYRLTEMHNLLFSTTNIKIIVQRCSFMKERGHKLELITREKNTNKRRITKKVSLKIKIMRVEKWECAEISIWSYSYRNQSIIMQID